MFFFKSIRLRTIFKNLPSFELNHLSDYMALLTLVKIPFHFFQSMLKLLCRILR